MNTNMNTLVKLQCTMMLALGLANTACFAQTDGGARVETIISDYNGSGANHYTVVWVTTESGTFIKSLRKQGPSSWTRACRENSIGCECPSRGGRDLTRGSLAPCRFVHAAWRQSFQGGWTTENT